jgi:glycosyltransferase involved in cell wall biosynthesis
MKDKESLISVIIPTYNREKTLPRAINSVLNQTYKNWELIIVDDGSIDNTKKILKPYLKNKKIKYYYKKNEGVSSARNLGIKKARGEYIALLDSDDEFLREKLEIQLEEMEKFNSNFSICNSFEIRDLKSRQVYNFQNSFLFNLDYFMKTKIQHSASFMVFRKNNRLHFDENLPSLNDTDLILRYLKENKILFVKYPLVKRYKDLLGDRISSNNSMKIKGYLFMINKLNKNYYGLGSKQSKIFRSFMLFKLGLFNLLNGDYINGRNYLKESLYLEFSFKKEGLYLLSYSPILFKLIEKISKKIWALGVINI